MPQSRSTSFPWDAAFQGTTSLIANREVLLTRFTQLELLQGSLNEQEWTILSTYLEAQDYVELSSSSWQAAARIYIEGAFLMVSVFRVKVG
jgi:predicted nucleic acid-binding protein